MSRECSVYGEPLSISHKRQQLDFGHRADDDTLLEGPSAG
jgi:hypothetical protein